MDPGHIQALADPEAVEIMRYRAQRLEITKRCMEVNGSSGRAVSAALTRTEASLLAAIEGYGENKKYVIEVYVEDADDKRT